MEQSKIITINNISEEGLDDKFIELIARDLYVKSDIVFSESNQLNDLNNKIIDDCKMLQTYFDKEIPTYKRYSFILSVLLYLLPTFLPSEDFYDSCITLKIFYEKTILHYYKLQSWVQDIAGQDVIKPNYLLAYSDFVKGINISVNNCIKVLEQKHLLCKRTLKKETYYSIYSAKLNFLMEKEQKILQKSYFLIHEQEKLLPKSLEKKS